LELIGRVFLSGYNKAIRGDDLVALGVELNAIEPELRGFACEGMAMGLAFREQLVTRHQSRYGSFLSGIGAPHVYMAHVGAGWAYARLRWRFHRVSRFFDPLLKWLVFDGFGFHEGYFRHHWSFAYKKTSDILVGYQKRAYDQGLGRSLWFVRGADCSRVAESVRSFPEERQNDLWSGVGLACAYAGDVCKTDLEYLRESAGPYAAALAQGATFAAKARQHAGNFAYHTERACQAFCGTSAESAAAVADRARPDVDHDDSGEAYETWRRKIQLHFFGKVAP
jgi:hypothetical protein